MPNPKKAGRSWLSNAIFMTGLVGAVAYASFSSRPPAVSAKADPGHGELGHVHGESEAATAPETPVTAPAKAGATPSQIVWEKDFESAMQRARKEKKPIMIDFYTDWCSWCKELDSKVFPDASVTAESANWVSIKINAEQRPDVAGAYGVTGYPTIVFAEATGKPLHILPGYAEAPEFASTMKSARSKWAPAA